MIWFGLIYVVMMTITYIAAHDKTKKDDSALGAAIFWPVVWAALLGLIIYEGGSAKMADRKLAKATREMPQLTVAEQNEHLYAEISREIDADNRDWEKRFDQAEREWKVAHLKQAGGATSPCTCQIHLRIREDAIIAAYVARKKAEESPYVCMYCGEEHDGMDHWHNWPGGSKRMMRTKNNKYPPRNTDFWEKR